MDVAPSVGPPLWTGCRRADCFPVGFGMLTTADFERVVEEQHRHFFAYAYSLVADGSAADDIVQDALLTAMRRRADFRPDGKLGAWIRGIIRLKCLEASQASGRPARGAGTGNPGLLAHQGRTQQRRPFDCLAAGLPGAPEPGHPGQPAGPLP